MFPRPATARRLHSRFSAMVPLATPRAVYPLPRNWTFVNAGSLVSAIVTGSYREESMEQLTSVGVDRPSIQTPLTFDVNTQSLRVGPAFVNRIAPPPEPGEEPEPP